MLNSRKNALRWVKTANALVLVGCAVVFSPQWGFAQTHPIQPTCTSDANSGYSGTTIGGGAREPCAGGNQSIALGVGAVVTPVNGGLNGSSSIAIGSGTQINSAKGVALGSAAAIGSNADGGTALGAEALVLNGHANSTALGSGARTSAARRVDLGATKSIIDLAGTNQANAIVDYTTSYRFAGLALSEDGIGAAHLMDGETFTKHSDLNDSQKNLLDATARNAIINRYRDNNGANRVLQVDGHGVLSAVSTDVVNIGTVGDAADATGSIYSRIADLHSRVGSGGGGGSYDDTAVRGLISTNADAIGSYSDTASDAQSASLHARINKNRADIASFQSSGVSSDTMAQIQGNTQAAARASQGAANAAALSAIPAYLEPGKKLFLGLGAGSHDGKSATAIGIMGKWGASTLLNAGFATGGGESTTRIGIGWSW